MTTYIFNIISLLGGLALFLFGMDVMGSALERTAGGKLQTILAKMSSTVPRGFLLGLAVTAVIQSSSATTVMVVGFVNSGIMTLQQAVGVIMGANVGTTVTAWMLSLSGLEGDSFLIQIFKPSTLAPLLGTIGIVMYMGGNDRRKGVGSILLGFLGLMTGMDMMSSAMSFLKGEAWFADLMISFTNPLLGILFGAVLTAIIQSSSASVGILQGLCVTGKVTFGSALPIILGQNIGTCITAIMGAIGANRNARRTAVVHLMFNVVGVTIFAVLFYGLGLFIDWKFLNDPVAAWDIAVIHSCFNLAATATLMPMNKLLVKIAYLVLPETKVPEKTALLDERLIATPAVAVQRAHEITTRMAICAAEAVDSATALTRKFDDKVFQQVTTLEDETDSLEDALGTYLVKLSGTEMAHTDNRMLNTLLYSISDLERIADHALAIAKTGKTMQDKSIAFSEQAVSELSVLQRAVSDLVGRTVDAFRSHDIELATKIEPQEQVIDGLVREIKSRHIRRLRDGKCTVEYGFTLDDLLTSYERIADHCSNVAAEMIQSADDRMDVHEYLDALKSGELTESAEYNARFDRYSQRYAFPKDKD